MVAEKTISSVPIQRPNNKPRAKESTTAPGKLNAVITM